ncbi:MAG: type III-B CRISPR module RAMP protein Cmr4 [Thermodesulfobacteriota bacterium]
MFTSQRLIFYYAVTPVHMGAGQALGVIDNPIQRERHTEHPSYASSGIKGAFRDEAQNQWNSESLVNRIFGPDRDASDHAGAVSFTDAQLVAFPVRSLKGVYVYVTSPLLLQRLLRLAAIAGVPFPDPPQPTLQQGEGAAIPEASAAQSVMTDTATAARPQEADRNPIPTPQDNQAVVINDQLITRIAGQGQNNNGKLVLESFTFTPLTTDSEKRRLKTIATWISASIFPNDPAWKFFKRKFQKDLVLVSDDQLTYFARNATLIEPHVRINDISGTSDEGGLFFTENLPPEALMAGLVMASEERLKKGSERTQEHFNSEKVMEKVVAAFDRKTVQIGGDATTGRGRILVGFAKPMYSDKHPQQQGVDEAPIVEAVQNPTNTPVPSQQQELPTEGGRS